MNFKVLWLFTKVFFVKVFSVKFESVASFGGTSKQSVSFLCENLIFHQFAKVFSRKSFPLYCS